MRSFLRLFILLALMAGSAEAQKVSDMPIATSVSGGDYFPFIRAVPVGPTNPTGFANYRTSASTFAAYLTQNNILNTPNVWSAQQTFAANPVLSACTGYVYGNGATPVTCINLPQIDAQLYGARQGGSIDDSRTGSITAASDQLSLSVVGDFQSGDDVLIAGAGSAFSIGPPSGLVVTQNGVTGSTSCTFYAAQEDGLGGVSTSISTTITNAAATRSLDSPIEVSVTPSMSGLPVLIWEDCGGGEQYQGAAQPIITQTTTPGSGYTPGAYEWTASGGGASCIEPSGFIVVGPSGAIRSDIGRVELENPGLGCTSALTVSVPAAAGGGVGGTITLTLVANLEDAGVREPTRPWYAPATHPTVAAKDWMIAQIGPISGLVASLCQPGTYNYEINACGAPMTAVTSVSGASVRHDWTRVIQNAINAANPSNDLTGIPNVQLRCGSYEISSQQWNPALTFAYGNVALSGGDAGNAANQCTHFLQSGAGATIGWGTTASAIARVGILGIYFDGQNKTGGYAISAIRGSQETIQWNAFINDPGNIQAIGFNNAYIFNNPQSNNGWGYGLADFDFESAFTLHALELMAYNTYSNDQSISTTRVGGTTHDGWRFNDLATFYGWGQIAVSNAMGHGFALLATTGNGWSTSNGGTPRGIQFVHCFGCDSEFASLEDVYVASCSPCEWFGFTNGSISGRELTVLPGAQLDWKGGKLNGGYLAGVWLGGDRDSIVNTEVSGNSGISSGAYPGVEIAASCQSCIVNDNKFGRIEFSSDHQNYPVAIDAPYSQATVGAPSTGSAAIAMSGSNPGVSLGMTVYDATTSAKLGTVSYWDVDNTLYLRSNSLANGSPGDTLYFYGINNVVCNNNFNNNVHETLLDNSVNNVNVRCQNAGDTSPGYAWDNFHKVFGSGVNGTYSANSGSPGDIARETNTGGDVVRSVWNDAANTVGNAARFRAGLNSVSNGFADFYVDYNSGTPRARMGVGGGLTGGGLIDMSGGGASATLKLRGGSGGGVVHDSSGPVSFTNTTLPTQNTGVLGIAGTASAPTTNSNSEGNLWLTVAGGLNIEGQGSSTDLALLNKAGTVALTVPTGTQNVSLGGNLLMGANPIAMATPPTFTSGACTGAMGVANNAAVFTVTTGSGSCGSTFTLGMPSTGVANGWVCEAFDEAAAGATRIQQTSDSTSSVIMTNFSIGSSPAATNFPTSHTVKMRCAPY